PAFHRHRRRPIKRANLAGADRRRPAVERSRFTRRRPGRPRRRRRLAPEPDLPGRRLDAELSYARAGERLEERAQPRPQLHREAAGWRGAGARRLRRRAPARCVGQWLASGEGPWSRTTAPGDRTELPSRAADVPALRTLEILAGACVDADPVAGVDEE